MRAELRERERHLRKPLVGDVFDTVGKLLEESNWPELWNRDMCQCFYRAFGVVGEDDKPLLPEKEIFRVNVSLHYVLRQLRDYGLRVSYWPVVPQRSRQYLAIDYDDGLFVKLWRYETLLCRLIERKPNFGMEQEELCTRLMLAAIALDGVVVGNVDGRLASLHAGEVKLDENVRLIRLAAGKTERPKQYYLGRYTTLCFRILLPRSRKDKPIFPDDWQMGWSGKRKSPRRLALESLMARLWRDAFPYESVPEWLNVPFWIQASQMSLALDNQPSFILANLTNRLSGAQYPYWPIESGNEREDAAESDEQAFTPLSMLHGFLPERSDGRLKLRLGDEKSLTDKLRRVRKDWMDEGACSHNEAILLDWLVWMAENSRFKKMKLSTFRGYLTTVANRVFPIPEGKILDDLSAKDWEWIGRKVAEDRDYAPSSRRTAITHLRRLNEYLAEQGRAPTVDYTRRCFQVKREIAECAIPFPHEVDTLLADVNDKKHWLAIVCSFYLGMRCEEICHLRPDDVENGYRLVVRVSKLDSSRRAIPHSLLMPKHIRDRFKQLVVSGVSKNRYLVGASGDEGAPMPPGLLSKQIGRLLRRREFSVWKMHALRHGFASWQLVRYCMLVDLSLRQAVRDGSFHPDLDGVHAWFSNSALADLAEVFGGIQWRGIIESGDACLPNATDLVVLSRLLGHANRFTTLENYTNSLGWISRYYLHRREDVILDGK